MKVGFIGLGIMGLPMCANLIKAGHQVIAYDRNPGKVKNAVEMGALPAENSKRVGEQSEVVITMLQDSPHVMSAIFDEYGLAEGLTAGKTVIDMSSINPVVSREIGKRLEEVGVDFMDAPVSGGEVGAIAGSLSIMVGANQEVFDQYYSLLTALGKSVVRCGDVGAGGVAKLANQMIVAINIAALSEALTFVSKAGGNPENVFQAIRGGLAGSTVMENKAPKMLGQEHSPGFRIELHAKDLRNAVTSAQELNAFTPLTNLLLEILNSLTELNYDKLDHSAIVKYFERENEVTL